MKQEAFEALYAPVWKQLEDWIDADEKRRTGKKNNPPAGAMGASEVPARYRRICQHLALARDRQYSSVLVERLNRLALRGHRLLYGARRDSRNRVLQFVFGGFAETVRAEARLVCVAALLFFGPLVGLVAVLQLYPDFVHYLVSPSQMTDMESMYGPNARRLGARAADTDVAMFGHYIWNNVKIGFQTFATGLLFGVGTVFFLLFNGIIIGAIAGHLTHAGYVTAFWSFVAGHSAMELGAIAISGAAGLKLGMALIAPGQLSRSAALGAASQNAVRLVYGASGMFLIAAFIEAFWSPITSIAPLVKYSVGIVLWLALAAYLLFTGRRGGT